MHADCLVILSLLPEPAGHGGVVLLHWSEMLCMLRA
jgi:hypothetical protein